MDFSKYKKITDVSKELQTDEMKMEVFDLVRKFVYKYQEHYHPKFHGDLDDLASDISTSFLYPKKHRNGEVFSELDRFDEGATGEYSGNKLATYVKRYVVSRLIDLERQSAPVVNATEKYDAESGESSLDYLARAMEKASDESFDPEEYHITPEVVASARDAFDDLDYDQQQEFKKIYEEERPNLTKDFQDLFDDLLSGIKTGSGDPFKDAARAVSPSVKFSEQSIRGYDNPVIKVTFDKNSFNPAKLAEFKSAAESEGYKFIKVFGSNIYFVKE